MRCDVENQERRDIFTRVDVVDCGKRGVFFGGVSKLFTVAEFWRGLLMDAAACFSGFNHGGDIVRVAVDRNAADDVSERDTFGFGIRLITAKKRGELCARRVATNKDPVGVAAKIADVFPNPAKGFRDVLDE